ncbi:MAG: VWA domain-containing protein [Thermaerobacter sp.]|jgi:uncharacterized protein YegL|nr:VWA domain-containing protein [Thermaerobacter sp.]
MALEEEVEVAYPQQPHCAVVLVLDVSGSMAGPKIQGLNEGLRLFLEETGKDALASKRVDLALITFGGTAQLHHDFDSVSNYAEMHLECQGGTPMGEALQLAMGVLEERKQHYRQQGIEYYRPWLFLITDGEPTDMNPGDGLWNQVCASLREGVEQHRFAFFAVGVDTANMDLLSQLSPPGRSPVRLRGLSFAELFRWLSNSQKQVSASRADEEVKLPTVDWGSV